jgi:alpha-tubulin suppressor-like RCC1 family protein
MRIPFYKSDNKHKRRLPAQSWNRTPQQTTDALRSQAANAIHSTLQAAVWALLLSAFVLGCAVDLKEGVYQCDPDSNRGCPPGWVCSLRPGDQQPRCFKEGTATCGNGKRELSEECDGEDFGLSTCSSRTGLPEGNLECNNQCEIDVSGCFDCGNGSIEGPEQCDGSVLGGETCQSQTGSLHGQLGCDESCRFDTADCHTCGNTILEVNEQCDGTDLGGATCEDEGFSGGMLSCDASCLFDISGCFECGDGICDRDKGEDRQSCSLDCGWATVSCGGNHSCALSGDGQAWCWGSNDYGQLGNPAAPTTSATPTHVIAVGPLVQIAAGDTHTCGLDPLGDVWCWGDNEFGQLGIGQSNISDSATPLHVETLSDATELVAGQHHTCARDTAGAVWCWGINLSGQLGDATQSTSATPVAIQPTAPFVAAQISAGGQHTCAVEDATALWCWGNNSDGQFGNGSADATPVLVPTPVPPLADATPLSVSTGGHHTCMIDLDAQVLCWGRNDDGQVGCGNTDQQTTPQLVDSQGLAGASMIAAGWAFSCALLATEIWCWGRNESGQLGVGWISARETIPTRIPTMSGFVAVSTGGSHTCALEQGWRIYCWGDNSAGQLGAALATTESATPLEVLEP